MIIPLNPKKANHKKILELNTILFGFNQSITQLELQMQIAKNHLKELYSKEGINSDVQCDLINQELKY
jgi:hypothetical protein